MCSNCSDELIKYGKTRNENQRKINFSNMELEIIRLYACEYRGKEIFDKLGISLRTIESHKKI